MPLNHSTLTVPFPSQVNPMVDWLTASLSHLGFREHYRPVPLAVGLGEDANAYFWIAPLYFSEQEVEALTDAEKGAVTKALGRNHIAFEAKNPQQVREFYRKAVEAGGIDNGKPGPRPQYHQNYYGAFVRDPIIGVNWEVVFHGGDDGKSD